MTAFRVAFDDKWREDFATLAESSGAGARGLTDRAHDMGD
jgi:hypothetical protein